MGLKELKQEILREAEKEADEILKTARLEAENIAKMARAEADSFSEIASQESKSEMELLERRERASAEFEAKKMVMQKKREILERLLAGSRTALESMPEKKRKGHINSFLRLASSRMECGHIICSQKDSGFLKGYPAETGDIAGGIIVENRERTERIDLSYGAILERILEDEFPAISKIIFS